MLFFFAIWSQAANFAGIIYYFDIKILHYRSASHRNVGHMQLGKLCCGSANIYAETDPDPCEIQGCER